MCKKQNEYRKLFNNWKKSNVGKTGIDFLKKKTTVHVSKLFQ